MNNDICRCANDDCPLKENCLRWTERPIGEKPYVRYAKFMPEADEKGFAVCEYQIVKETK